MPTLDFEGTQIAFTDSGQTLPKGESLGSPSEDIRRSEDRETVVLLHCTASSSAQWRHFAADYDRAFRVIAVDLYGHGGTSSWPGTRPVTLNDEARAVMAVIAAQDGPVHLVGHSYGGAVALQVALAAPQRLLSLSLVEPVAFYLLRGGTPEDLGLFRDVNEVAQRVSTAVTTGDYAGGMARFVDFWNGPGAWASLSAEKQRELCASVGAVALNFWTSMTDSTRRQALCGLYLPTLIVEGERSQPATRRICELLRATIPATRTAIIPGAGHMSPLSHPAAVNAVIARHAHRHAALSETRPLRRPTAA
jgi:pimeloyl-ACP methyl ester carboxylesterase